MAAASSIPTGATVPQYVQIVWHDNGLFVDGAFQYAREVLTHYGFTYGPEPLHKTGRPCLITAGKRTNVVMVVNILLQHGWKLHSLDGQSAFMYYDADLAKLRAEHEAKAASDAAASPKGSDFTKALAADAAPAPAAGDDEKDKKAKKNKKSSSGTPAAEPK